MSRLTIKSYHVSKVCEAKKFALNSNSDGFYDLSVDLSMIKDMENSNDLIKNFEITILPPGKRDVQISSIMDILPISVKVLGKIGEGITHTLTGVYVILCGEDVAGNQICAFGNSDGILSEQMVPGKCGTPSNDDYIILMQAKIKEGEGFSRPGPEAVNFACDMFCDKIREQLKKCDIHAFNDKNVYDEVKRPGKPKVAIVKMVSGQGAMYDTHFLPDQPSGYNNSKSIIDITGAPMIISPNEYRDGAIKAMY